MRDRRFEGDIGADMAQAGARPTRYTRPKATTGSNSNFGFKLLVSVIGIALLLGVAKYLYKAVHTAMPWLW